MSGRQVWLVEMDDGQGSSEWRVSSAHPTERDATYVLDEVMPGGGLWRVRAVPCETARQWVLRQLSARPIG
jgi:hypothetical protein